MRRPVSPFVYLFHDLNLLCPFCRGFIAVALVDRSRVQLIECIANLFIYVLSAV
jgi:hypothetical protein